MNYTADGRKVIVMVLSGLLLDACFISFVVVLSYRWLVKPPTEFE